MAKNGKYSAEERKEVEAHMKRAQLPSIIGMVIIGVIAYGLVTDKIDFGKYQGTKARNLTDLGPRIKYVLQHSTPGVVWLLFCVFYVISKRAGTPAVNPTAGHEHLTEGAKNIFLNSLEQFVMLFVSQLILVTYLEPKYVLNVIPVLNLLFISGRIFFWLGYPKHRALGMMLNFVPIISVIGFIGYKYIRIFV